MKCPKCYGKINKITKKCEECGFNVSVLIKGENKPVKEYKKQGRHDEIVNTKSMPVDLTKKKMLLWCIFLGFFGAHNYVVGKTARAVVQTVLASLFVVYVLFNEILVHYFIVVGPVIGAICFLWFLFDLTSIIFNFFSYPVVMRSDK